MFFSRMSMESEQNFVIYCGALVRYDGPGGDPENVTEIGRNAFRRCSTLTRVTIPEGVTRAISEKVLSIRRR